MRNFILALSILFGSLVISAADNLSESAFINNKTSDYFNQRILLASYAEQKRLITFSRFFRSLSIGEIYRLSQYFELRKDSFNITLEQLELSLNFNYLFPAEMKTMLTWSNQFVENPNTFVPDENETLIAVFKQWINSSDIFSKLQLKDILKEALDLYKYLQNQTEFGEIYNIAYHSLVPGTFKIRSIYLAKSQQAQIDSFFSPEYQTKYQIDLLQITDLASSLVKNDELNLEEFTELRNISEVSAIFEQMTFLAGDWGGWAGNLIGTFAKTEQQTICHEEVMTYHHFLNTLVRRNLIKYFRPIGSILRLGHEANLLQNKRTNKYFIFDSWLEDGGIPAHILIETDWAKSKDNNLTALIKQKYREGPQK